MVRNFVSVITRHWVILVGSIIALVALVMILLLIVLHVMGFDGGAYLGIITYMLLPMVFGLGLVLIPVGVWLRRRQEAAAAAHHESVPKALPVIDLNNERTRGLLIVSVLVGMISTVLIAGATVKGVKEMETVAFCGTVCHTVMEPEHVAFQRSPHSKITCADCHIGSGADWFVKSKISGSWQMVSVALDLYPRPVTSPVHSLRPARETCEQCHWPTKHVGDKLQVTTKFADDEANTETKTVLLMKVGGQQGTASTGIHWHVDRGVEIRYLTDATRQKIYDIEMTTPEGKKVFKTEATPDGPVEWRTMDCVDCHNRASHTFRSPEFELDLALQEGRIDRSLPYIRREGARILTEKVYESHEEARAGIAAAVQAFYAENYPDLAGTPAVEQAGVALGDAYTWNNFPHMKVTWNLYPNHIGHEESPGCFRCHSNKIKTDSGERIGRKCSTCHEIVAEEESDSALLQELGLQQPPPRAAATDEASGT